jgi:hypothetical protein
MLGAGRMVRYGIAALAVAVMAGLATPSWAQTTGTVVIDVSKAGFIVGVGGGKGVLRFQGRSYPFSVGGLSFGAQIGASRNQLVGRALNLRQPTDITGTYAALGAGVAVAGGAGGIRLQNAKGVILELQGRKVGVELSANISGVQISMP